MCGINTTDNSCVSTRIKHFAHLSLMIQSVANEIPGLALYTQENITYFDIAYGDHWALISFRSTADGVGAVQFHTKMCCHYQYTVQDLARLLHEAQDYLLVVYNEHMYRTMLPRLQVLRQSLEGVGEQQTPGNSSPSSRRSRRGSSASSTEPASPPTVANNVSTSTTTPRHICCYRYDLSIANLNWTSFSTWVNLNVRMFNYFHEYAFRRGNHFEKVDNRSLEDKLGYMDWQPATPTWISSILHQMQAESRW
ncbi:hypothetical protein IWQ62_000833 [Dispira parvispora]|uniref:Uncharacterized protein n=1 Tax=Dispira parvispora TaxID=1520584 RepID=A0A9W8ATN2_9FUNG|nr:hypothetical protein IWQ62_000833 [Dispira parvispora]